MFSLQLVSRLRRCGAWGLLRRLHGLAVPPVCQLLHVVVARSPVTPTDIALKHHYDYAPILVRPEMVRHSLQVGDWRKDRSSSATGPVALVRRWYTDGGGWKSARRHVSRNLHGRFILDGDWDRNPRFHGRPTITQLFVDGRGPQETDEYRKMSTWVVAGDLRWTRGCHTAREVDRYFEKMAATFESIRRDGYRTQEELGLGGGDEIRICIDRQGGLCVFGGGTDRLSMARVLQLGRVPVLVKRVHAQWGRDRQAEFGGSIGAAVVAGLRALEEEPGAGGTAEQADPMSTAGSAAC